MSHLLDIRQALSRVLSGELSESAFEQMISSASRRMFRSEYADAIDLIAAIDLRISERYAGLLSQSQLLDEYRWLLSPVTLESVDDSVSVPVLLAKRRVWRSSSSAVIIVKPALPSVESPIQWREFALAQ
jgi:hypothetical protein